MDLTQIKKAHHMAYRCRDAEQTRWFYETVLELPLAAALVLDQISGTDMNRKYMHLFFQLPDGSFVAFFDAPDDAKPEQFEQKDSFDLHLALEIDKIEDLHKWKEKIKAARIKCAGPIDHHFVHSIYFYDPNGIQVEITCNTPEYSEIMAHKKSIVHQQLEEWTAKTRAQKEAIFGAEALDSREVNQFRIDA